MNPQDILDRLALMAGLSDEEAAALLPLCGEAAADLRRALRPGVNEQTQSGRLTAAAAALAYYRYTLFRAPGGGWESFTAGDISVRQDGKTAVLLTKQVWLDAQSAVADLLEDDGFCFRQVPYVF